MMIISGLAIITEQGVLNHQALVIEKNKIKAIISESEIKNYLPAEEKKFTRDYFLAPGLIDLHIHGCQGKDVMDADESALSVISQALAKEGVTGFLATTMTAETETLDHVLQAVKNKMQNQTGATLLGVHLEGPFIAREKMGAQSGCYALSPDVKHMQRWLDLFPNVIKQVTIAPELPGAMALIHYLKTKNIVSSIGHTHASFDETNAAIQAGSSQATHLFNAMRPLHQREPGALGALLLSDDIVAELIFDEFHLHPAIVELALKLKGRERLVLVTDAMRAKCLGDGQYDLGGQMVNVRDGKATLEDGTLAGSTLSLPRAIQSMSQIPGCSLVDAIHMASRNPARALGLGKQKGVIAPGFDADLVVLNAAFEAVLTISGGEVVYSKS